MSTMEALNFACEDCSEVFSSRNKLFSHIRQSHDEAARSRELTNIRTSDASTEFTAEALYSRIVIASEDDLWYSVAIKPQGLATMGRTAGSEGVPTLMSSDLLMLPDAMKLQLPYKKAVPCHRLDLATGGIVLCSKSKASEIAIKVCFRNKLIRKRYRAVVPGRLEPPTGIMDAPISGKKSFTRYSVVCCSRSARYGWLTTVDLWPVTGRKHQLRKHLMLAGHPIIGDKRYSRSSQWPERIDGAELMFLWALEIDFPHPEDVNEHIELLKSHLKTPIVEGQQDNIDEDDDDDDMEDGNTETMATDTNTDGNNANIGAVKGIDDVRQKESTDDCATNAQIKYDDVVKSMRRVVVSIEEPVYYAKFREFHQSAWEAAQEKVK